MRRAVALFVVVLAAQAFGQVPLERKYGVATTIYYSLVDPGGIDLEIAAACAAGDSKIIKDGGTVGNTGSCFSDETTGWYSLALTGTEMEAANISISLIDQSNPKIWLDKAILITTYGHVSAQHEVDLDAHGFALSVKDVVAAGIVDNASFSPTATQFESTDSSVCDRPTGEDLLADTYIGSVVIFDSGALARNRYTITDFEIITSSRCRFTIAGAQQASADNDEFVIQ